MKKKIIGNITPKCEYCKFGNPSGSEKILCIKKGILEKDSSCRKFSYDPIKRIPEKKAAMPEFSPSDFQL